MSMDRFNEKDYATKQQQYNINRFLDLIESYEKSISAQMLAFGYKKKNVVPRTVTFSFGTVTFYRSRWYRDGQCRIPVDEYLHLDKRARFSKELLYRVAKLSTYLPYRKVAEVISSLYNIDLSKDVVLKASRLSGELLEEYKDYRYFEIEKEDKKPVDILYIEGDGLFLKSTEPEIENKHVELAHFVIHEGYENSDKKRKVLKDKKEFISRSYHTAKEQMIDYIYNNYDISESTVLISNSDNGKGYTTPVFKTIAKDLSVKQHEHFIDKFHINENIKKYYQSYPCKLQDKVFLAIQKGDKALLKATFDTTESLIEDEAEMDQFRKFSHKMLREFKYLLSPAQRGLKNISIGIMESQHRKITYRMKKRGMYWSNKGVERMSQMILRVAEGSLRELFFGDWRKEYQKYKAIESSAFDILKNPKITKRDRVTYKLPRDAQHKLNLDNMRFT